MSEMIRTTKVKRYIEKLEDRAKVAEGDKRTTILEIAKEMRVEFGVERNQPPFGYSFVEQAPVITPDEFEVIRLSFDLQAQGSTSEEVKRLFNEFKVPKRGRPWPVPAIEIRKHIFKRAEELIAERNEEEED